MSWNYRMVREYDDGGSVLILQEVHYLRGTDWPEGMTQDGATFAGQTAWEIRRSLWRALLDTFRRPELDDPFATYTITEAGRAMLRDAQQGEG